MRRAFGLGLLGAVLVIGCGGGGTNLTAGTMPPEGTFTGVYFSPQYGEMHMVQNGSAVVGKFKKDERSGDIQGETEGDLMRFEWTELKAMVSNRPQETRGHGYFRYMLDSTNGDHVLKGRWGLGDDDTSGGEWNAYKSRSREPDLEQFDDGSSKTSGGESSSDESSEGSDDSSSSGSGSEEEGDDVF